MLPLNVVLATVLRYIGVRRKGRYRESVSHNCSSKNQLGLNLEW